MNNQKLKLFTDIGEMDEINRLRFSDFKWLNDLLNWNALSTYEDLYNSYVKVVLDIWGNPNYREYSELDFQVKMLIDEIKVPLNRVIDFARLKFWTIKDLLKSCLLKFPQMKEEDAIETAQKLLSNWDWYIVVQFHGIDEESSNEYLIYIDTWLPAEDLFKSLREWFSKLDFDLIKQWKIIWAWIGFKKV